MIPTNPPPPPARRSRLLAVTVAVASLGVLVALVGLVMGTRPLESPTQDCGTAFAYLLDGRVDIYVNPESPPEGVTPAEARANNAEPCQERAAARARPAGALLVGGTLLAAAAAATDLGYRTFRWYRSEHAPRLPRTGGI